MTNINAVKRRVVLSGSAGTGPYAFTFEILDDDDIQVFKDTTLLTKTADYTVTINSNGTGSVTLAVAATSSQSITIIGARDIERTTDFVTAGDLKASSLNEQLDALTIFDQQIDEKVDRSLKGNFSDPTNLDYTIPSVDNRKGKYLQFNSTTGAPEAGPNSTDVTTLASVASDIGTLADIQDGTTATNAITTVAGISSNVSTVAGISSNVTTVAGISSNVTAVAGDASDIGTVASNISSVNTNATNITAIQGASANASTATTKASEAAASQAAAASSASSASTSAATATTKAAEASTSAGNASTSETNSAASATAAASSATAAAASQTAAAASAASAASAFDNFDDRFLGSKTSDPSTDNDGDALVTGALYFNSTANEMRVFDGGNFIAATSAGNVSLILYEYTATAGQTTFSGSDDNSATLSYTVDNLQVVINGIVLDPSDFTATNGTSVVLASGAALNDLVNIYAFKPFTTADMVSKTAGGTFAGAVGFSGGITGDVAFDTNTLKVDSANNRLGISEASPDTKLHLTDHTANAGPVIRLEGNSQNTAGNLLGGIECFNADASGDGPNVVSAIKFLAHSAIDHGGQITFSTHDGTEGGEGSAPVERVRIDQDGKVGIGTNLPTQKLDVSGTGNQSIAITSTDSGDTSINFADTDNNIGKLSYLHSTNTMVFRTNDAERMRINSGGNLLLGQNTTTQPGIGNTTAGLGINATGRIFSSVNGAWSFFNRNNDNGQVIGFGRSGTGVGGIDVTASSTAFRTSSDHRLKQGVEDMTGAIDRVKALAPKRFQFTAEPDTTVDGFLAHETQAVVPEAVSGTHNEVDDDGNAVMQGIDHGKLVPLLTGALREAIAKIETLEAKVAALEAAE